MRVEDTTINRIFINGRSLHIPFFQRPYVWEEENWERFFNDLEDCALALSNDERDGNEEYFMGSVILRHRRGNENECDIIDGQQRLTTIVLFMKALCLKLGRNAFFSRTFMTLDENDQTLPILVPSHNDRAVYNDIINKETFNELPLQNETLLAKAYNYFVKRLRELESREANNMLTATQNSMRFVTLEISENENAQKIFETINSTGIRLTTGELLKNYLYQDNDIELYENTWKPVFEGHDGNNHLFNYWNDDILQGRIKSSHISEFFYRYLMIKIQDPNLRYELTSEEMKRYRKKDGLFEKFKSLIEKHNLDKLDIINEVVDYARIYTQNIKNNILQESLQKSASVNRIVWLMYATDFWTPTPYILYLLKTQNDHEERNRLFGYLETYLVRRIICKSKNNNYSDLFSENLIGRNILTFDEFHNYINDADSRGTLLMPSDEEVRNSIVTNDFDLKKTAAAILYLLESKLNENVHRDHSHNYGFDEFKAIQVINASELKNRKLYDDDTKVLIKTLGNIVLCREKLGDSIRRDWNEKRNFLYDNSRALMLSDLSRYDDWSLDTIRTRNNILAEKVIEVWSL